MTSRREEASAELAGAFEGTPGVAPLPGAIGGAPGEEPATGSEREPSEGARTNATPMSTRIATPKRTNPARVRDVMTSPLGGARSPVAEGLEVPDGVVGGAEGAGVVHATGRAALALVEVHAAPAVTRAVQGDVARAPRVVDERVRLEQRIAGDGRPLAAVHVEVDGAVGVRVRGHVAVGAGHHPGLGDEAGAVRAIRAGVRAARAVPRTRAHGGTGLEGAMPPPIGEAHGRLRAGDGVVTGRGGAGAGRHGEVGPRGPARHTAIGDLVPAARGTAPP